MSSAHVCVDVEAVHFSTTALGTEVWVETRSEGAKALHSAVTSLRLIFSYKGVRSSVRLPSHFYPCRIISSIY
jgi:hypothetical protein